MAFVVTFLAVLSVIILMFIDKIIEYLYPKGSLLAVEKDLIMYSTKVTVCEFIEQLNKRI